MGKGNSDQASKKSPTRSCPTVFFLIVIILSTYLLARLQPSSKPSFDLEEVPSTDEVPHLYHDTLILDVDIRSNARLAQAEEIWRKMTTLRKKMMATNYLQQLIDLLHYFPPAFNCPHLVEQVGHGVEGGKWVCGLELFETIPECVVYSFGVSDLESSFEAELINRTEYCRIFGFDFGTSRLGPAVDPFHTRVIFESVGIGVMDEDYTKMLRTLMERNGNGWIDILKIDIGPNGMAVVDQLIDDFDVLPFGQLHISVNFYSKFPFEEYFDWFERLEEKGLRQFHAHLGEIKYSGSSMSEMTVEYGFMNLRGKHNLLTKIT